MDILRIIRGDDTNIPVTIKDSNGDPVDITGYTLYFTVKSKREYQTDTDDTDAVIALEVVPGSHTDPTQGESEFTLTAAASNSLIESSYAYDVQMKDTGGKLSSSIPGDIKIIADVTRRTS